MGRSAHSTGRVPVRLLQSTWKVFKSMTCHSGGRVPESMLLLLEKSFSAGSCFAHDAGNAPLRFADLQDRDPLTKCFIDVAHNMPAAVVSAEGAALTPGRSLDDRMTDLWMTNNVHERT